MSPLRLAPSLAVGLLGWALPAQSGCIGDDGLAAAPCWQPVSAVNLPAFPDLDQSFVNLSVGECRLRSRLFGRVRTRHIPISCDTALIGTEVDGSSFLGYAGILVARYARTWVEPVEGVGERQVWRFLVNGDLQDTVGGGSLVHFVGHVDYACEPDHAAVSAMALSLTAWPGEVAHNPFDPTPMLPAASRLGESQHIISPANFNTAPAAASESSGAGDALRSTTIAPLDPLICFGEADVSDHLRANGSQSCFGSTDPGPLLYTHQAFQGVVDCDGVTNGWGALPNLPAPFPPLPTGFVTLPLGSWNQVGSFPGRRNLELHWGILAMSDPCNSALLPFHVVTGVSTSGATGQRFDGETFDVFTDLQNMISLTDSGLAGPYSLGWGELFVPTVVWNLNGRTDGGN